MAVAERFIIAGESGRIEWFTIRDTEGVLWRYHRTDNPVDLSAIVHARWENNGQMYVPVLVRGDDGEPILRQDGHGLPEKIAVSFDDPSMRGTSKGLAVGGTYQMDAERVEFIQVAPADS